MVFDLYSFRKRIESGDVTDVYTYDEIPETLKAQVIHIWNDAIGPYFEPGYGFIGSAPPHNNTAWDTIHDILAREKGVLILGSQHQNTKQRCVSFLLAAQAVDDFLDIVEVSFVYIGQILGKLRDYELSRLGAEQGADSAIAELNLRFRRASLGYQFEQGKIVRVDNDLVHQEVVKRALRFLSKPGFEVPSREFLDAHAHYRASEYRDAIVDAGNAFESALKVICDKSNWPYKKGARASDLIKVVREKGLFPDYLDSAFDQLAATLQSGLPQVRNNEGAHGQGGAGQRDTPHYIAAYALHLAGANIIFLSEAFDALIAQ